MSHPSAPHRLRQAALRSSPVPGRPRGRRARAGFRPQLETLEDRLVFDVGFRVVQPIAIGNGPRSVAVADFNRDGKPDFAVANVSSVQVALGAGNGSYGTPATVAADFTYFGVAVGDFNGDDKADLVTAVYGTNDNVQVFLGNGDGTFGAARSATAGLGPVSVAVADFNRDGRDDVVVGFIDQPCGVSVLLGNGDGTLRPGSVIDFGTQNVYAASPAVGDFNRDGIPDFAVTDQGNNRVRIELGKGDGTFDDAPTLQAGASPFDVVDAAVADLNGDGKPDLVVANFYSRSLSVFRGNGDGTFRGAIDFPINDGPLGVAVADFNADGIPDLAATAYGPNIPGPPSTENNLSLFLGYGDGTFQTAVPFTPGKGPVGVAAADLNRDGLPDLAVANQDGGTVAVLLNTTAVLSPGALALPDNVGTGRQPTAVAIADFNEDGRPDLAVADGQDNTVSLLQGEGDGTFRAPRTSGTGNAPAALVVGDFNRDGRPDLAVANRQDNTIAALLGNGDGSFRSAAAASVGTAPNAVAMGDFNRDGKPDLTVVNGGDNTVSALLGVGDGTFQVSATVPVGNGPSGVAVGDFNRDGKPDLAVANGQDGTISVLLGNGNGTFAAPTTVPVGNGPSGVAVGDFNRDGKPDLAVANKQDSTVGVLLGNGDGTFGGVAPFGTGNGPAALVVRDFNADGIPDLATGDGQDNTVSLLLGNGDGTFQTYQPFAAGNDPVAVAAADLNGDGFIDVVTANGDGNNASVLINQYVTLTLVTPPGSATTYGQAATFTATVTAGGAAVTGGTVAFFDGATQISGDLPLNQNSQAVFTTSALGGGSHSITAVYSGTPFEAQTPGLGTSSFTTPFTVNPAALTVTANAARKVYGQANPAFTASYSGFVRGEGPGVLRGSLTFSTQATQSSPVGTYPVTPGGLTSANYAITFVAGTLTVTPATLTVTAANTSRPYGQANPTFTARYSGFVLGQTLPTSGITGSPALTTTAIATSPPGNYVITAARGSLAAANYTFAFVNGTLTVTTAELSAAGRDLAATAGAPFRGIVATFRSGDPFGGAAAHAATIAWGDGTTTVGAIATDGAGGYTVTGSHTYAAAGDYVVRVTVGHRLGHTNTDTATAAAAVRDLGLGVERGQTGTVAFWASLRGLSLIARFNGGPTSRALADWLASAFPNLYGSDAGLNNLTGRSNLQVAAFYLTRLLRPGPKAEAQVLATALNLYATTRSLGGTTARAHGFAVSDEGLGARSFNVGSRGAAFGVPNGTTLNTYQLLRAVNQRAFRGLLYPGSPALRRQAADLFADLNDAGSMAY